MIIIILLCLCTIYSSLSLDCPVGNETWQNGTAIYNCDPASHLGEGGTVDYKYRNNQGSYEIVIDWSTFVNYSDFIPDES